MGTPEAFDRVLDSVPSTSNGFTLCQGNFTLMTSDLPTLIRRFGSAGKIVFVHFRDVAGDARRFVEVFHDEGPTDMLACMQAYAEVGPDGPMRPDHVPALEGESNETYGYAVLGRLFAVGYITGLREAAYGRPPARYGRRASTLSAETGVHEVAPDDRHGRDWPHDRHDRGRSLPTPKVTTQPGYSPWRPTAGGRRPAGDGRGGSRGRRGRLRAGTLGQV